jgi:hypothetical protein
MAKAYILADPSGALWSLQVNDQGRLTTTSIANGTASPLTLNDPSGTASWQILVNLTGVIETQSTAYSSSNPFSLVLQSPSGATNWSIRVALNGQLQTVLITAFAEQISGGVVTQTPFEIPLQPTPQNLTITMAGVQYNLYVYWNAQSVCWMVDIADVNDNPIVNGIAMVTGADLLEQFGYLGFGGQLIAQTDSDLTAPPTFQNLGSQGHLYFVVLQEAA